MSDEEVTKRQAAVLARPGYRRLWAARTVSQWGDVIQFTTVALLALRLTDSGVGVSGAALAEVVPLIALAPLAGPLVDRLPRVKVMVSADLVRMVLAAVLAVFHGQIAVVYAVAFGLSAGSAFFNPAAGSLLPSLVDDDQLVVANSGIWSAAVLSQVVLAPVAGLLAATVGYGAAFGLNAASFAASAALLAGLRSGEAPRPVAATSMWVQGRQALGYVAADRLLRALAVAQALAALSAGATSALLVVLVRRHLHASTTGYGLAVAAIGVGAFVGPSCSPGSLPGGAMRPSCSGRSAFAAWSTSPSPRSASCRPPSGRSAPTGSAPRRATSASPRSSRAMSPTTSEVASSPPSTSSGTAPGW